MKPVTKCNPSKEKVYFFKFNTSSSNEDLVYIFN